MVLVFYYLCNKIDVFKIKIGYIVDMDMFFDKESYKFCLKFLGREILKIKFGKISILKFCFYVEVGRVFKEKESLIVWVIDDDNKIFLLIKVDLVVGFLKVILIEFKGLKNLFKIIVD